jgi:hypothetical protein
VAVVQESGDEDDDKDEEDDGAGGSGAKEAICPGTSANDSDSGRGGRGGSGGSDEIGGSTDDASLAVDGADEPNGYNTEDDGDGAAYSASRFRRFSSIFCLRSRSRCMME